MAMPIRAVDRLNLRKQGVIKPKKPRHTNPTKIVIKFRGGEDYEAHILLGNPAAISGALVDTFDNMRDQYAGIDWEKIEITIINGESK